ncbi:hypothetical protein GUJ93_ZPchr0010g9662 [Zizania palustris]|uniref:Secreted protein n=1 Tax=Zizania palustris TaxID=103762 RepID=A0A8J6BNH2_ZIZPA|nr:hypothetical protein GUJ93_ZPchr0010g9662 [Zizania palustris]
MLLPSAVLLLPASFCSSVAACFLHCLLPCARAFYCLLLLPAVAREQGRGKQTTELSCVRAFCCLLLLPAVAREKGRGKQTTEGKQRRPGGRRRKGKQSPRCRIDVPTRGG